MNRLKSVESANSAGVVWIILDIVLGQAMKPLRRFGHLILSVLKAALSSSYTTGNCGHFLCEYNRSFV